MNLEHGLFLILLSVTVSFTVTASFSDSDTYNEPDDPTSICKSTRSADLERECGPVLSSVVSKAKLGSDKLYRISRDLSFQNGDWMQEPNGSPLMPFDDTDMPNYNVSAFQSLLKLVSFYNMGIDFEHQIDTTVGVCALMSIGITRNRTMPHMPQRWTPWFHKSPGYSDLTVVFEGLYVESQETGERLMCLLGTSLFPYSNIYANSYEYWAQHHSCKMDQSRNLKNDQIMLVLRYPQNFSLMNRAIIGEMKSLLKKSDAMYFDNVHISSMMSRETKYHFSSGELVASTCKDFSCHNTLIDENIHISKGSQFCDVFQRFANSEAFDVGVLESDCNGKYCSNLGPFMLERNSEGSNQTLDEFKLIVSDYRCVPGSNSKIQKGAKVFAVFRAISYKADRYTSEARSGLSGMTISAEGTWDSSSGQLCMIGCVGIEMGSDKCNSKICIYFPKLFSITRRQIFIGTISSFGNTDPYASLIFKKELWPQNLWNYYNEYTKSYLVYKYSKIELATKVLEKNRKLVYETFIKKFLIIMYPSVKDKNNLTSLSFLSRELGFSTRVLPNILYKGSPLEQVVRLEVLTLGPMFGSYWEHQKVQTCEVKAADSSETSAFTEDALHLNISAQLSLTGTRYSHVAELLVEGLYDPFEGKMYLIGCRSVPKSMKFGKENHTLENDMDCLIEVMVEYTSKTTRWLVNPTVKVSIISQRKETNPLYFSPISLKTALITYRDNFIEVTFRQNFELIFRVVILLSSIAFVLRQFYYVDQKVDAIHIISLVMLGIQITSYTLPLVMNTEILFKWKEYQYPESRIINSGKSLWLERLDCALKCLLLVAFILTLRLFQKVWDSRKVPKKSSSWKKIPSEKRIFLLTFLIHIFGFLVVCTSNKTNAGSTVNSRTYVKVPEWENDFEKYMAIVQDLFLLPQIMGNLQWKLQGKPLSKVYYIGFSVLRFVVRGYDYIRDPIFSSYFHKYDSITSSVFFTKSENFVIMFIVVALAIIVHVQQAHLKF